VDTKELGLTVTEENFVVTTHTSGGSNTHYAIYRNEAGEEFITLNKISFAPLRLLNIKGRRERVKRG
jgi:hypothetical protein